MALQSYKSNNADDSKGKTWGFEGENIYFFMAAVFVALCLGTWLHQSKCSLPTTLAVCSLPVVIVCAWIFALRQGKPPRYDMDLAESLFAVPHLPLIKSKRPQWLEDQK